MDNYTDIPRSKVFTIFKYVRWTACVDIRNYVHQKLWMVAIDTCAMEETFGRPASMVLSMELDSSPTVYIVKLDNFWLEACSTEIKVRKK